MGGSIWDNIVPALASVAAIATGNPELVPLAAGIGSGVTKGVETGNPLTGLLAGVGSGAGSYLGGQLLGPALSGIGSSVNPANGAVTPGFLGRTLGQSFGNFAGNSVGGIVPGTAIGGAIGGSIGNDLGTNARSIISPENTGGGTTPPGFSPSMSAQAGLPQSLSQFGSLTPNQQASNIATKGVYGGGNGPDETNYFLNLLNRQQFDQGGNLGQSVNASPVEQSYLSQLGISGYNDPTSLLKGISQYGT